MAKTIPQLIARLFHRLKPHGSLFSAALYWIFLTILSLPIQAQPSDQCPTPVVGFNSYVNGKVHIPPGHEGSPIDQFIAKVHEIVEDQIQAANVLEIQFASRQYNKRLHPEFVITLNGTAQKHSPESKTTNCATSVTMLDRKGRVVLPTRTISYKSTEDPFQIAQRIAAPFRKLRKTIRRHQVKVREETKGAIYPTLEIQPDQTSIPPKRELVLELKLYDCGPNRRRTYKRRQYRHHPRSAPARTEYSDRSR